MSWSFAWAELISFPGFIWRYTLPALVALICAIPVGLIHAVVA